MSLTKFTSITGTCVPVPGPDMDTDRIIPSRFLKCITFDELAGAMFWDERFDENGQSKSHPVDDPRFKGASTSWAVQLRLRFLPRTRSANHQTLRHQSRHRGILCGNLLRQQHRHRPPLRVRVRG